MAALTFEEILKKNPYHDPKTGRFTTGPNGRNAALNASIPKTIKDCKTTKEVEQFFREKGYFYKTTRNDGSEHDTNKMINLENVDVEVAKGLAQECEDFFNKFPQLKGQLNGFMIMEIMSPDGKEGYGECLMGYGRGGAMLNEKDFEKSLDRLNLRWSIEGSFHPENTNVFSVLSHELGHAADDYLSNTLNLTTGDKKDPKNYVSSKLRTEVMKTCGKQLDDIKKEVSGYATENATEWFAECIAEYVNSPNPRPVAMETGRRVIELLNGGKL